MQLLTCSATLLMLSIMRAACGSRIADNPRLYGAGATVNACIWLDSSPSQNFAVNFIAGGSGVHCMNSVGNNNSALVSASGMTCAPVGYVEEEDCTFSKSIWVLAYNGGNYSGSTTNRWETGPNHNEVILYPQQTTPGTSVCTTDSHCPDADVTWDSGTVGSLWFIFAPGTAEIAETAGEIKTPATGSRINQLARVLYNLYMQN